MIGFSRKLPISASTFRTLSLVLVLLTPLMYSTAFIDAVLTPKVFWFQISSIVLLLFAICKYCQSDGRVLFTLTRLDFAFLSYQFYLLLRLVFDPFVEIFDTMLINQIAVIGVYGSFRYLIKKDDDLGVIFWTIAGVGFILVLLGWVQIAGYFKDMTQGFLSTGTYGNPGALANYLVLILPIFIMLATASENLNWKFTYSLVSVLMIGLLITLQARASWVAILVITCYFIQSRYHLISRLKTYVDKSKVNMTVITFISFLGICLFAFGIHSFKPDSSLGRLFIWKTTLKMIQDRPILGHGVGKFPAHFPDYQANYFQSAAEANSFSFLAGDNSHAFNEYLTITSETGLIGLLLFLCFAYFVFFEKQKPRNTQAKELFLWASRACLLSLFIVAFFSYPLKSPAIITLISLFTAIISGHSTGLVIFNFSVQRSTVSALVASVLIIMSITIWKLTARFQSEKSWKISYEKAHSSNGHFSKVDYLRILPVMRYNHFFLFNYGAELSTHGDHSSAINSLKEAQFTHNNTNLLCYLGNSYEAIGDLLHAEFCFQKASYIIPHKFYPKYKLVHIYEQQGRKSEAIQLARHILKMRIKVNSPIVKSIRAEMNEFIKTHPGHENDTI